MNGQQINIPLIEVGGITFNLMSLVSIDRVEYLADTQAEDRNIVLNLASEVQHIFTGEAADLFNKWYCSQFGQTSPLRVMP
jgi:hypothetical protein